MREPCLNPAFLEWFDAQETTYWRMFEYGAGFSTLWFAERVAQILCVEHNQSWYDLVADQLDLPHHVCLLQGDAYPSAIEDKGEFDFILIDGRARILCANAAVDHVKGGGYLALDDSQRQRYLPAVARLSRHFQYPRTFHYLGYERELSLWKRERRSEV